MMIRFKSWLNQFRDWWALRDPATRLLVDHVWQAITNFGRYGSRQAAALAYYTIFSIFPLTLLLTIGVSRLLGSAVAQEQIASALAFFLPETSTVDLLVNSISQALDQNASFGLLAVLGLAWSGLGLFSNITTALDSIFHVPRSRSIWRQRLVAVVMILILLVLVSASFVTSGVLALLSALTLNQQATWLTAAGVFLPLSVNMMIFLLLFRYVPARAVHWDAIWPTALLGAAGFELAKRGFGWYLANLANYQVVYGGITTVIILLFWAYMLASVFLFSAELCAQLNIWLEDREDETAPPLLMSGDEAEVD
jgi:membrane protein